MLYFACPTVLLILPAAEIQIVSNKIAVNLCFVSHAFHSNVFPLDAITHVVYVYCLSDWYW